MESGKKTTALDHIGKLAEKCATEISNLARLVAGVVEEDFVTASIPTSAWEENTDAETKAAGLAYKADVAVTDAEAADGVDAVLAAGSLPAASACGMATVATVVAGAVRFYAVTVPTAALTVQLQIIKGK